MLVSGASRRSVVGRAFVGGAHRLVGFSGLVAECLEIHGTGWVEGEVEVGSLVVDEGGTLQGTCTRKGAKEKPEKDLPPAPHRRDERTATGPTAEFAAGRGLDRKP